MASKFKILKEKFNGIKLNDNILMNGFKTIEVRINNYELVYNNIFQEYQHRKLVIGLDEFHFQKNMLMNEKYTLINFYDLIINRMYADYFKISKSIKQFIKEINKQHFINPFKNHLKYNYIQLTDKYKLKQVEDLFTEIISVLEKLNEEIITDELNFLNYKENMVGLNINNFLISFDSEIKISKNRMNVFYEYLEYYIFLHNDYYNKLSQKINLILTLYNVKNNDQYSTINDNTHEKNMDDNTHEKIMNDDNYKNKQNIFINIKKKNDNILESLQKQVLNYYR